MYNENMFSLNIISDSENNTIVTESAQSTDLNDPCPLSVDPASEENNLFTEAVFKNGKEKIKPIEEAFAELAIVYKNMERSLKNKVSNNKIKEFYKHDAWKNLEKNIIEIFGIRSVIFEPMSVRASRPKGSTWLNCYTYTNLYDRFPVDGLLTDDGFYDKSHTLSTQMSISQELFAECTPAEVTAIFLHELGHNIDPALIDINYTGIDILVDSLLGKKVSSSKLKKLKNRYNIGGSEIMILLYLLIYLIPITAAIILAIIKRFESKEKKLERIKKLLKSAKEFNRKNNTEAYADNIARMYGYGSDLMSGLRKLGINNDELMLYSYKNKAKRREKVILDIYENYLKDVHGTDVQRIIALIKEYEDDLNDPSIPKGTKKWMEEDKKKLEEVLDAYINDKDKMKSNINKMIKDAMQESGVETTGDVIKESVEYEFFEEGKKDKVEYISLTPEEQKIASERFGENMLPFITKDNNGYLARTHRARTKSYPTLEALPKSKVDFIKTTD